MKAGQNQVIFDSDLRVAQQAIQDKVKNLVQVQGDQMLLFNSARLSPLVKEAVVAAIDPQVLNQRVNNGTADVHTGLLSPKSSPLLYPTGVPTPQYDVAKAKQLLAQAKTAGYSGNISITCAPTPNNQEEMLATQALLQAAGFNVQVVTLSPTDNGTTVVVKRDFDITCFQQNWQQEGLDRNLARSLLSTSSSNYFGYQVPEFDSLVAELQQAQGASAQQAVVGKMQTLFNTNPPVAFLWDQPEYWFYTDNVHGLIMNRGVKLDFQKAYLANG
jgi:peptide/nickel transport system substrate-binding protein